MYAVKLPILQALTSFYISGSERAPVSRRRGEWLKYPHFDDGRMENVETLGRTDRLDIPITQMAG